MTTEHAAYVSASDLFAGFPEAWELFSGSDPDCCWGDNALTLVSAGTVLGNLAGDYPPALLARLDALHVAATYIDLER